MSPRARRSFVVFFFLSIRLPRRSTLFPYTPLFRSKAVVDVSLPIAASGIVAARALSPAGRGHERSEEHTSELQSLRHLVCRLLLEKKNNADYCMLYENYCDAQTVSDNSEPDHVAVH